MQRTDADHQRWQHIADASTGNTPRLLPWTTEDGKRCMLSGKEGGFLSRLADEFETVQLAMGSDVLMLAREVLENPASPHAEVRYSAIRLAECLTDALRIAESRGLRLPERGGDEGEDGPAEASA
ncbi:hypothetical protein ACFUTV_14705 [Streptomyces sp. NPDC057298]|uniref:hypothetical protein n=1 Tax=Streptomyces sp. NPDC057298 TaxID=3346091 RepID=UPI003641D8DC